MRQTPSHQKRTLNEVDQQAELELGRAETSPGTPSEQSPSIVRRRG